MICREVLLDAARKVGIEEAAEFLEDPEKGLEEVFLNFLMTNLSSGSIIFHFVVSLLYPV